MFDKLFLSKLQKKYNYDEKTIKALARTIPNIITYFGEDLEDIILEAIYNCQIIPCNSHQTISKIEKESKLTKNINYIGIDNFEIKKNECAYLSNIEVSYNEFTNTFNIDKISRIIATSHTYNYDSPKGLEVLTYALCKLVKSYKNEYTIEENKLIKRSGISTEINRIIKDKEDIYLETIEEKFKGLEEGLTIFDTEQIVSLILDAPYKCYDYDSIHVVAQILKDKFELPEISYYEINADIEKFTKLCNDKADLLSTNCDECLQLEHEMFISEDREEKDELAYRINRKLSTDIYNILISIYQKKEKNTIKI